MCGIIGYTGRENALPKMTEGLSVLEYRGYDSVGIAAQNEGGKQSEGSKQSEGGKQNGHQTEACPLTFFAGF